MACTICWQEGRENTCDRAVYKGHLDCLIWARKNGCPLVEKMCNNAAYNGHLDCLIWVRKNGCPWDEWTCTCAAYNGHLDCLIWARKNGCPWDAGTCKNALYEGHKNILKWIHKNGSPCDCMKSMYIFWDGWVKGEECNICLERLDDTTVKFWGCKHHYHKECMDTMLDTMTKKHCSICERTQ